ncbi:MAG TPA: protein-tyrosine kinase [Candidatus Pelethocola excrementipullorum]|nr:protein-tyrosine kinase [Candidatus Pelethocola excrementipullorum]
MDTNQQDRDVIEINLLELARELWSKKGVIILAAAALGMAILLFSKLFITPQYESTTKFYVLAKQDSSMVTSGDLQASTLLTKDYAELIKSRQVTESVISQLNLDMKHEDLLGKLTIATPADTRIVTISVKDEDPYRASEIANAVREAAAEQIQKAMNTEAVNMVEQANIPDNPVSPRATRNGAIGGVLGAFAAIAIILIIFLTNDTIKTSEDVERYLQLSTLGVIPLAEGDSKAKKVRRK